MTVAPIVTAVVAASSLAAGCHDQPTQVVLVVNSDVLVPSEVNSFGVTVAAGPFEPPLPARSSVHAAARHVSDAAGNRVARRDAELLVRGPVPARRSQSGNSLIVVSKTVTDMRFVAEQTRMLLLELPRSCACQGTSCPLPGDPVCDKITNPALVPFDPALAPATRRRRDLRRNGTPQ